MVKHLLFCSDGSRCADKARKTACHLHEVFGCKVSVVCVADIPDDLKETEIFKDEHSREILKRYSSGLVAWGKGVLERDRVFLEEKGVQAAYYLEKGAPTQAIVRFAKDKDVDLIVIGSRGLSEMTSHLMGSVSDGINHKAACSVLIVH
jgi:nucleotide-binding universal stress UspA family protein